MRSGHQDFSISRIKAHLARIKEVFALLPVLDFDALRTWSSPAVNLGLMYCAYLLAFHLRQMLLVGTCVLCAFMVWELWLQVRYSLHCSQNMQQQYVLDVRCCTTYGDDPAALHFNRTCQ